VRVDLLDYRECTCYEYAGRGRFDFCGRGIKRFFIILFEIRMRATVESTFIFSVSLLLSFLGRSLACLWLDWDCACQLLRASRLPSGNIVYSADKSTRV
jgi:hypothetical protein